jgi:hypothetical protein
MAYVQSKKVIAVYAILLGIGWSVPVECTRKRGCKYRRSLLGSIWGPTERDRANADLLRAAKFGDTKLLEKALKEEACLETTDVVKLATPLYWAARNGRLEVIKILVDRGAEKEARNRYGITPLHVACMHERLDVAIFLISHGASINSDIVKNYENFVNKLPWECKKLNYFYTDCKQFKRSVFDLVSKQNTDALNNLIKAARTHECREPFKLLRKWVFLSRWGNQKLPQEIVLEIGLYL